MYEKIEWDSWELPVKEESGVERNVWHGFIFLRIQPFEFHTRHNNYKRHKDTFRYFMKGRALNFSIVILVGNGHPAHL